MTPAAAASAYIGLGGNEGDAVAALRSALQALEALPLTSLRACSAFYRTPAWGLAGQPDFVNAVAELQTRLGPRELLGALLEIECQHGRVRRADTRWGPRPLDLDLLLHGDLELDEPGLTLPHPHLHQRAFVLLPLLEIAPSLSIPGHGPVAACLAAVDSSGIAAIP